ncbi:hypothetical protein BD413DRAFT_467156, partial [Trametes elegans]
WASCHRLPRSQPGLVPYQRPTERPFPPRVALRNGECPALGRARLIVGHPPSGAGPKWPNSIRFVH